MSAAPAGAEQALQLAAEIRDFVLAASASEERFDELTRRAFTVQLARVEPYARLCRRRGLGPDDVAGWRDLPTVPTSAFKTLPITVAGDDLPAAETFRSSGTTEGEERPSAHRHPFPDLYRATIDASLPRFCPVLRDRPPILALVPSREQAPDSSLAFMVDHAVARWGGPGSAWGLGPRGVDARAGRSWAGAAQRAGRPALVIATSFALADWLDSLARLDLRFRLPPGSLVFETGGFKGRRREVSPEETAAALAERLHLGGASIVREYGMTELTSQLYGRGALGGDSDLYTGPHWVRVHVLEPETLEEAPAGETGLVAVFDLANLSSAVHVLTEDLGRMEPGGLRLLGRAPGAELRGCSLAVEELAG